jgi:phosphohistidine phosphatase
MELLLIRHGEAVEAAPGLGDTGRWLTAKGRRQTRKVASWLGKKSVRRPVTLWTSPLVRAVQTAEIVAERLGLEEDVTAIRELAQGADPAELLRLVMAYRGPSPLGLVGHEPGLSALARLLLGSHVPWPGIKKSGIAALSFGEAVDGHAQASLRFLLVPKGMKRIHELVDESADAQQQDEQA